MNIQQATNQAKEASIHLAVVRSEVKNKALEDIARALDTHKATIESANMADIQQAIKENLAAPLLKRLKFDENKIADAVEGLNSLIGLADPVGITQSAMELDQGLELFKVTCPIGVIGIVFESRPDALVQISSLCLKSGNAVLMKGGSEAANTNRVLADIINTASIAAGIPAGWLHLLEARSDVSEMLEMDKDIDLVIPRGSNEFVRYIMENTNIPVLGHADGVCHVYVDSRVDIEKAIRIIVDSKTQYVAVCNAVETILVHKDIAEALLPKLKSALEEKEVEIRGCAQTVDLIDVKPATNEDWNTEYLDLILSIKIVGSLAEAINHINQHGSRHTDVIVTAERDRGVRFMDYVDSANVFLNCSSRFSDGFRFGLGAEVGISTSKIHSRGPVGLEGLVIYKWRLAGDGHIVADYSGKDAKTFTHRILPKDFDM
jgi:glutamate-5-semialdehyde dehydrogenase